MELQRMGSTGLDQSCIVELVLLNFCGDHEKMFQLTQWSQKEEKRHMEHSTPSSSQPIDLQPEVRFP